MKLEPCPFCGNTQNLLLAYRDGAFIECLDCQMRGPQSNNGKNEAEFLWNRRAGTPTDPAPPPELVPKKLTEN